MNTPPAVRLQFDRRPSALRYMVRAIHAYPRWGGGLCLPDIAARWCGFRAGAGELQAFLQATNAGPAQPRELPLLYPHTIGFRLQMALLTDPAFPLPIWRVLQVRNHLLQHRPIGCNELLEFETRLDTHRLVEKGLEVDLRTRVLSRDETVWQSLNTFYVRGQFGPPGASSPLAQAPVVGGPSLAQWHMPSSARLRFGALTGDYNGLHLWNAYARRFGFKAAFFHTQRVLGQCLAHLGRGEAARPQRLDAWLKGPVYYDCDVRLCAQRTPGEATFALFGGDEQRPALVGRIQDVAASAQLP